MFRQYGFRIGTDWCGRPDDTHLRIPQIWFTRVTGLYLQFCLLSVHPYWNAFVPSYTCVHKFLKRKLGSDRLWLVPDYPELVLTEIYHSSGCFARFTLLCLVYLFANSLLQDRHVKDSPGSLVDREPEVDPSQDYQLLLGYENSTHTVLRFKRRLDTCDYHDIPITVSDAI